ncbi:MAG: Phosphate regulon sensor protein PhoR [Myxococcaceae bacterium]|nr:Phosphate regulon sensor protein PhoR [Myxococcaceae bacterium]
MTATTQLERARAERGQTTLEAAVPALIQSHVELAARSQVPIVITRGDAHIVHFANAAFASFLGESRQRIEGRCLKTFVGEPERADALIERACHHGVNALAPDLAYARPDGEPRYGSTLVLPIVGLDEPSALVQVIDTTALANSRGAHSLAQVELQRANQELLMVSLREHELAETAARARHEVERLLHRKSLLAEASTQLAGSLELERTLAIVAQLALPELADCAVLRLLTDDLSDRTTVAHVHADTEARLRAHVSTLQRDPDLLALTARVLGTGEACVVAALGDDAPGQTFAGLHARSESGPEPGAEFVLRSMGARAALAVPLRARDKVIGVLVLATCAPESRFQPEDLEFAVELARRGSMAIDNARLYYEAKLASRMREDMLAIVSHDLRNPLSAISMSVERLLKYVPDDDPHEIGLGLELIHRSSRHMRRLIEELLDVASIQSGQLNLQLTDTSIPALLGEALEMLLPIAQRHGVELVLQPVEPTLKLRCDREKVLRVVANLVGNAVKFTPRQGNVSVSAVAEQGQLRIDVADTGRGIARSELPRLFEQYWKGEQTGRTGMGLGLFIARGIVETHGGRIWVESVPGQGSTFSFTIPGLSSAS